MLGMTLLADGGWKDHLHKQMNQLRRTLEVLRRLYYKIPRECMKLIAEGIFNSHLRCGIILTVRPRLSENEDSCKTLKELQILHNEMQRIILGLKRQDRIRNEERWKLTGMMTVNHMSTYHNLVEMYNIIKSGASESIQESLRVTNRSDRIKRQDNHTV